MAHHFLISAANSSCSTDGVLLCQMMNYVFNSYLYQIIMFFHFEIY